MSVYYIFVRNGRWQRHSHSVLNALAEANCFFSYTILFFFLFEMQNIGGFVVGRCFWFIWDFIACFLDSVNPFRKLSWLEKNLVIYIEGKVVKPMQFEYFVHRELKKIEEKNVWLGLFLEMQITELFRWNIFAATNALQHIANINWRRYIVCRNRITFDGIKPSRVSSVHLIGWPVHQAIVHTEPIK